jgi:hypothetical protein
MKLSKFKKYLLPISAIAFLFVGFLTVFISLKQTQFIKNKAATPNGIGTISLVPITATHYTNDLFPMSIKFNTGGALISSVVMRLVYRFTGTTPELEVTDSSGNVSNQIYPANNLTSTGDWAFPIKSVTRTNGTVTIDFSAIDTNTAGFSSTTDTDLGTIFFKVNRAATTNPVTVSFDTSQSKMLSKGTGADILSILNNANYTLLDNMTLNLKLKLQGLTRTGPNTNITAHFGNYGFSTNIYSDTNGIYSYTADTSLWLPATYDAYIKEPTHLQKKFSNIILAYGNNNLDFTASPLLAGDFNNDNNINILDLGKWLSVYTQLSVPVTPVNQIYDVNGDGVITIQDLGIVLSNYTQLNNLGDSY